MAKGKLLQALAGAGAGSATREGVEQGVIPQSAIDTVDTAALGVMGGQALRYAYNKLPESYKKKVPFRTFAKAAKKQIKDKFTSPKAIAKRGAKTAGSLLTGPFAPLMSVGFLGHDLYDMGKKMGALAHQKISGKKRGGQVKKTKRKIRSKPRGVGKALRGYGAVSR
ncbi:MAG: hypothetical protein CL831_00415 [Crocinitomicaceae bacterium]|nr:hypothetical protein [Crocinitomicaceae bacterium]